MKYWDVKRVTLERGEGSWASKAQMVNFDNILFDLRNSLCALCPKQEGV